MLKGTTTIQLFNAKSGEKEFEYKKSNLVTNAMSNLVNPSSVLKSGSNNSYAYSIRQNLANAYDSALGGIFLFNDFHGTDPNKVMPDASNKLIGFAGNETTIKEDVRQGVRNTAESQAIENGYRLVWDFPTDKANGVIKSVSLTSVIAGNTGGGLIGTGIVTKTNFKEANTNPEMLYYPFSTLPITDSASSADGGIVFYIKPLTDGKLEMLYFSGGYTIDTNSGDRCIYKLTYENPNAIKPLRGRPPYLLKKEKISEPIHDSRIYNWSVWVDSQKKINITYMTSRSVTSAIHKIYSLNGELETTTTVTLPSGKSTYSGVGFANGKYYCAKEANVDRGINIISFSDSGQIIAISDTYAIGTYYYYNKDYTFFTNQNTGELLVSMEGDSSNDKAFNYALARIIDIDGQLEISVSNALSSYEVTSYPNKANYIGIALPYIDGDIGIKPPYTPFCYGNAPNSKYARLFFHIFSYYLGTINDLDTAITKTSAQTMKVIYELTEAVQNE